MWRSMGGAWGVGSRGRRLCGWGAGHLLVSSSIEPCTGRAGGKCTTEMILAAKFPGSSIGKNSVWTGHVWAAALTAVVVVTVESACARTMGSETLPLVVEDGTADESGSRRAVSCAAVGKLRLALVSSEVVSCANADVAERSESRK